MTTLTEEEAARLRERHPIHELMSCGPAALEERARTLRDEQAHGRTRLLIDSVINAAAADLAHLVDMPLAELLESADETLKWTMLAYLASIRYRPAQLELSARCAAEAYLMVVLHDTARGRTLEKPGDIRLVNRAVNDAEWMVGHAVGWGALANGVISENRLGTLGLTEHPKELGLEVVAALWSAVDSHAREIGYQEGYAAGYGLTRLHGAEARKGTDRTGTSERPQAASKVVVVPHAQLSREMRKESGVGDIIGAALPLVPARGLAEARKDLLAGHPHAAAAIEQMLGDLAEGHPVRIRPVLLVGPPGAGKSRLCRDALDALGIPFAPVDAGTTMDHGLTGAPRRWRDAYPSTPLRLFAQHDVANPGIVLDELEKAGHSSAGSIHDPLLSLLEPLSSRSWRDHFLDAEIDASHLVWLCTANSTSGIPAPLLNRLRVLRVPLPSAAHVPALADRIRLDILGERSLDPGMEPPLDAEELETLTAAFGQEGSLRNLRRYVEAVLDARASLARRN
ncbi:AAA family ATPase [Antarcticirhabdus aurantiaca]|uniref:AAA family ATPase n=1 Tax=Antarcticirhabdus aurantiaca TaxID=2606717 RepID=A0ACD4NVW3_9HYPH|nr:AAA family ATPase [Antarcticirhabdus aurantiaca]WAJ30997.1 AAA family ATPase [Jeongeuplla avenae]